MRDSPAAAKSAAFRSRSDPLVVNVTSQSVASASILTSRSMPLRNNGSPPVSRNLRTPNRSKARAMTVSSSKVSNRSRARNSYSRLKISAGMQ